MIHFIVIIIMWQLWKWACKLKAQVVGSDHLACVSCLSAKQKPGDN